MAEPDQPISDAGVWAYARALIREWVWLMCGVVGLLLAVIALWWGNSPVYPYVFGVGAAVAFVFAGYSAWSKQAAQVIALTDRLKPKLGIRFEPRSPWITRLENGLIPISPNASVEAPTIFFHLEISNLHPDTIVNGCRVALRSVEYLESGAYVPTSFKVSQRLRWSESSAGYETINIPHAERHFVDLVSIDQVHKKVFVKWEPPGWKANEHLFDRHGQYRLTVAASTDDGLSTIRSLILRWDGDWEHLELTMETP